jgi:2'-hydroxyisoflavone reductase
MRCLVVGGTGFLGGAIADQLVESGHSVAILSRGQTSRSTHSSVETITADRYGNLDNLAEQSFDWVFDSCPYSPDAVEALLTVVGSDIDRYVMVSSISAYGEFLEPGLCETANVPEATAQDFEVAANVPAESRASAFAYGSSYGPLKRACEIKAKHMLGDRATALRVGLLVGAGDYTDRLTWWVRRIDRAQTEYLEIPAPAPQNRMVQLIDVRDVALFALKCAADELAGIWNVTGEPMPLLDVLNAIIDVSCSNAELIWVSEDKIQKTGVKPWVDIPMMAPLMPEFRYFLEVSTSKARSAGLMCRPLEETLRPLLNWDRGRRRLHLKCGLTPEQEASLLSS